MSGRPEAGRRAARRRLPRSRSPVRTGIADAGPPAPLACGFPPVSSPDARVLVLGSLPGEKSIEMQQYYAQARNAFWPIMGELCGASPSLPYPRRLERLRAAGIALWDVLAAGERRGSLDSAIVPSSMVINDFAAFFAAHPAIRFVSFNGSMAAQLFMKRVLPTLPPEYAALETMRLPSTSPANASYSFERKLAAWTAALRDRLASA
ncbi:MAG TPA: DNA-deoxyinosine glycosylase [Gammaproteobacteria bacterium]